MWAIYLQILEKRLADYKKGIRDPISSNVFLEILLRMWVEEGSLTKIDVRDECTAMLIGVSNAAANFHILKPIW